MSIDPAFPCTAPVLAIVIPCFNEQESIPGTLLSLLGVLDKLVSIGRITTESFLYFVDDGSTDNTWYLLSSIHKKEHRVRCLKLSRNFGHQTALIAGLISVKNKCDISISIDADLQQDPNVMDKFIESYLNGADIVFGVRNNRVADGIFKRITALAFYRIMSIMGVTIIKNHADYRLLSKRALEALTAHNEPNLFLRAICVQLGFKTGTVYFDVVERNAGVSKYSLRKMLKLAVNGITSFSIFPLRIIAILGVLIFGLTALMAIYVICRTLLVGDTVPGWASTTLPIYFLGGVQVLCIGIIGEYLAEVVNAVKQRPRFIIETELF
ncbi:glycosyltransferase family 2 protein [uncultured Desulfobulbus sp.]|uniref:glycosyltransferase family 2 protein n=1 Tax=uncultured Desulfobulbus sp. TaxID=239745 RepID=UPI0029C6455B|nr:glycosyltransferase family 2 protein [uncultured Desulfobulbus sp.]